MTLLYYDIEVFKNFFSALFISEDFKEKYVFYKFGGHSDIPALLQFIQQRDLTLVGYNNLHYDDPMMKLIIANSECTNKDIYNWSQQIITTKKRWNLLDNVKEAVYGEPPWRSSDMMTLLKSNMNSPSLKHCAIHLEHDTLQDLPKAFDSNVLKDEVEKILKYNKNDVILTGILRQHPEIIKAIQLREGLRKIYGVDLISADDSKIGNVILEKEYGIPDKKGTPRSVIHGHQLVPPTLKFKTKKMNAVLEKIRRLTLVEVTDKNGKVQHLTYPKHKTFSHEFEFDGTSYKMGKGGLHSEDEPRILKTNSSTIIRDCDVGSYYPMLGHVYGLIPAHLDQDLFKKVRWDLITRRLAGKHSGDKVTADGLKIAINGMFGKMNYSGFWLYDPLPFFQTTVYGQLLLLMLIEMLYLEGIHCVSANTDGIVCEIPRELEDTYFAVCVEWQKATSMTLEYNDYNFLVQLNVNSYMTHAIREGVHNDDFSVSWTEKDDIKTKKDFSDNKYLVKQSFVKGYQAPVMALALQNYFKSGIPIKETIAEEENIHNFFFTQKTGKKFTLIQRWANGTETALQKTNRFYVTVRGAVLVKQDLNEYRVDDEAFEKVKSKVTRESGIWKGQYTCVLNDMSDDRLPINRQFYIDKVQSIIDKIEPKKVMNIFDFL